MRQITRFGSYGIIINYNQEILLNQKKSGPYKNCWGLPGGKIEFGENPEDTLQREIQEENALYAEDLSLYGVKMKKGVYRIRGEIIEFHHIGILYKIGSVRGIQGGFPEENFRWVMYRKAKIETLTPFAKVAVFHLQKAR